MINNLAYVGDSSQYQAYRQIQAAKQWSNENLEAAQINETRNLAWDIWAGGEGVFGGLRR